MIKMTSPKYTFEEVIDLCGSGITGNAALNEKINTYKNLLIPLAELYRSSAEIGSLYTIDPVSTDIDDDPIVVGALKKSELEKLYTQYLVPDIKPAFKVYDIIKNSAKEKCPFCGGIGVPETVDHFLPKSPFPQFAILPLNLVPACRDCNMGNKGYKYAEVAEQQIIHPYLDQMHFFETQWVFARYNGELTGEPGFFEYFVQTPDDWTEIDKQRVSQHFIDFKIASRYAIQAARNLKSEISRIKKAIDKEVPIEEVIEDLLMPAIEESEFINDWHRGMFQALIKHLRDSV